jgi:Spy/CpxP family protein refolding chaperone
VKAKLNFRLVALGVILGVMLVVPALGQDKNKDQVWKRFEELRTEMVKQLKLAPDKEKALLAVEDKYAAQRQEINVALKKSYDDLQAALAAANPDEAKVKELVSALIAGQDNLSTSFKDQRAAALALMTPVEQGRYLVVLGQWRQKMMEKIAKEESAKKK